MICRHIIWISLIFFLLTSCKQQKEGRSINLPLNLLTAPEYRYSVFSYLNGDCGYCIDHLKSWERYAQSLKRYEVNLTVLVETTDSMSFIEEHLVGNNLPSLTGHLNIIDAYLAYRDSISFFFNEHPNFLYDHLEKRILLEGGRFIDSKTHRAYIDFFEESDLPRK